MAHNPLFPDSKTQDDNQSSGYVLPSNQRQVKPKDHHNRNAAANVIRDKLNAIYAEEPGVKKELEELEYAEKPLSKHQKFLQQLQSSATSIAEIQTRWHQYYVQLPANEKHKVWQEFYEEQAQHSRYAQFADKHSAAHPSGVVVSKHEPATPSASRQRLRDSRNSREIKEHLRHKVSNSRQREQKGPLSSLLFGLATGATVLVILLFGLFNERVIAPFIQPSRNVSATPIILNDASIAADGTTKIIIPKINVEIPVDYNVPSMQEADIQKGLEGGVVHYPSTVRPGEQGNTAIFGHSSNNIFNPGKYKFAFVLLSKLENGDMFYLTYNKQVYAYKVYEKRVVNPDEVSILNPVDGKTATATLITCDPPGTTLHRLVVWGEQVNPSPADNVAASPSTVASNTEAELPGPAPSLWNRMTGWLF